MNKPNPMELTYTVRGADGKEYGPVSLPDLSNWIREGRLNAEQEVRRSDMQHWSAAKNFSELMPLFTPAVSTVPPTIPMATAAGPGAPASDPATAARLRSGASWFYWVAGLSVVNSIAAASGHAFTFYLGLGITQVLDGFGKGLGSSGTAVALLLNILVAGIFVMFGVFAYKRHTWAFIAGMVLFALDTLFFLVAQIWVGFAFHVFVLYCLFRGLQACRELQSKI